MAERDHRTAYLSGLLWLPRLSFDSRTLKSRLTFTPISSYSGPARAKPKIIQAWAETSSHIGVPWFTEGPPWGQHFLDKLKMAQVPLVDLRPTKFDSTGITSRVVLDTIREGDRQQRSVEALLNNPAGILALACGAGKSVIALHAAAQFDAPFIVIVDNKGLQMQWVKEIKLHLQDSRGNPPDVGLVGDGKKEWDKPVVVALIQTLARKGASIPKNIRDRFAVAIYDETAVLGAPEFSKAAPLFSGRRWGLSATPARADGLEALYYKHLGPILIKDLQQDLQPLFYFYRVNWEVDKTDPSYRAYVERNGQTDVNALFTYLASKNQRAKEIADIIKAGKAANRKILILSRRLMLLETLSRMIPEAGVINGAVTGSLREHRTRTCDIILAQLRLGERALDKAELDMIIVCEPMKRKEMFQQVVGRALRVRPGKPTPIVVFIEDNIGACIGMCRGLKRLIRQWPEEQGGPYKWRYYE